MYKNVGGKIQTLGKVLAVIGIIGSIIIGGLMIVLGMSGNYGISAEEALVNGIVLIILGPLFSWLSSLTLVGFGKLVEDQENTKKALDDLALTVGTINSNLVGKKAEELEK